MMEPLTVVIGYDQAEDEAYRVCRASLLRHTSRPLHIIKLNQRELFRYGLYWRAWHIENGQHIDAFDGKPFSTEFSFTRFLTPVLTLGEGYALFCDCDFLFTADVAELFDIAAAAPRRAVHVVKHDHVPAEAEKMGGITQTTYSRKNWSSLILWRCDHPANKYRITPRLVSETPGGWLHGLRWLDDDQIGDLPSRWNWLAGVDPLPAEIPAGIHYTLGVPGVHRGCDEMPYAELWRAAQAELGATGAK